MDWKRFPTKGLNAISRSKTAAGQLVHKSHTSRSTKLKCCLPCFTRSRKVSQEADAYGKSAEKGDTKAKSTVWAATSPWLEGVTGKYFDSEMNEAKLCVLGCYKVLFGAHSAA